MEEAPVSASFFIQVRLNVAITRLFSRAEDHNHLAGISQVVGISIIVGRRIFSIVGGLVFVSGHFRGFGRWQLGGQGLRWLHRLKRLAVV